jgi:hypothetical protein
VSSLAGCYRVQVFRVFAGVERKTGCPQPTRRSQGMTGLPLLPSRASVDVSPPHPSASVAGHFIMWILVQIATAREAAKGAKGDGGGVRQEAVSGISGQSAILSV